MTDTGLDSITMVNEMKSLAPNTEIFSVETTLPSAPTAGKYNMMDVRSHCEASSCWIVISDVVYDVTEFLGTHPGGEEILLEHAGSDATVAFQSKGHSLHAQSMLEKYCIGQLVDKDKRFKT